MNHRPRKRFGQNFLHDPNVIQRIVDLIAPQANEHLVEIGPGQGALTAPLLKRAGHVDAIELDRDLVPLLQKKFAEQTHFKVHQADALKFDFHTLYEQTKLRLVGNLPYNISTPLLFHLMQHLDCIEDMHFMLQKEVVERMTAQAGERHYGRLGIMLSYYCQAEKLLNIGPGAFSPPPKVDSAIVRLTPHATPPVQVDDLAMLSKLVTQAFSQRRKTLRNSLKGLVSEAEIMRLDIDPKLRPEQIPLQQFARLANSIS